MLKPPNSGGFLFRKRNPNVKFLSNVTKLLSKSFFIVK